MIYMILYLVSVAWKYFHACDMIHGVRVCVVTHMSFIFLLHKLHSPSMLAVKAKIYEVLYKQSSSIAFDETSSYWSALKSS